MTVGITSIMLFYLLFLAYHKDNNKNILNFFIVFPIIILFENFVLITTIQVTFILNELKYIFNFLI